MSGPTARGEEVSEVADVEKLINIGNDLFDLLPDPF